MRYLTNVNNKTRKKKKTTKMPKVIELTLVRMMTFYEMMKTKMSGSNVCFSDTWTSFVVQV